MKLKRLAVIVALVIVFVLGGMFLMFFCNEWSYKPTIGAIPVTNPLKGFAPWTRGNSYEYPHTMEFLLLRWSEVEENEGVYTFGQIEEKYNMEEKKNQGIRFIIRLVCDYPSSEEHMDIPKWLYDKTYGDGEFYDNSYGKGYSPNYSNPAFIQYHEKLIAALCEYYKDDPYIAYIELGSIGHWGEWHVNSSEGITTLPKSSITDKYVTAYTSNFDTSKLLMRRPYTIGAKLQLGLYNDSFGDDRSHNRWLSWIEEGYTSDQNGETFEAMADYWKYAPSGGEISSANELYHYYGEEYNNLKDFISRSHTTFLGPHCIYKSLEDIEEAVGSINTIDSNTLWENQMEIQSLMGYCFRIDESKISKKLLTKSMKLELTISNIGVAPMYENWPMRITMYDDSNEIVFTNDYDIELRKILPGTRVINVDMKTDFSLDNKPYKVTAGIVDPATGKLAVEFANAGGVEVIIGRID